MSNEIHSGTSQPQANNSQPNGSQINRLHASHAGEISGGQFLEELESRHNHVLDDLEVLNVRIEQVLKLYVEGRQEKVA